jgi:hypothetical protein
MRAFKFLSVSLLLMMVSVCFTAGNVSAGGGYEPPAGATITGPEIWGVVVIQCNFPSTGQHHGSVRVKRVVDCNTETEAKADAWGGCPSSIAEVEGESLPNLESFFGITGTAFINKAKNFQKVGDIVSFDAQFKFWY